MSLNDLEDSAHTDNAVFVGGGEMGRLIHALDWTSTPLGAPSLWPQSLRTVVQLMLTSRYQMWMAWGPQMTCLYNDAYRPTLGIKHPSSLAQPAQVVWTEIWNEIGPLIDEVMRTGDATYNEGMFLLLERSGFPEETYHTFSYSPLFDDDRNIAGMFCVVVEESERVISERRLATMRNLASTTAATTTEDELFDVVGRQLGDKLRDLPFTLIYLIDHDDRSARLVASSGFSAAKSPPQHEGRIDDGFWITPQQIDDPAPHMVEDLSAHLQDPPTGAWEVAPREALVVPIIQHGRERSVAGFLVAGINPHRYPDHDYRGFIDLMAGQIGAALTNARAYEAERQRAEALAEIDRAKTTFFSNVSHELRTPLTLMLGPLEEVLAAVPGPGPAVRSQIGLAHRNGVRLLRLVNSLLDFSRIEAGRMRAAYEPTDIGAFSGEVASTFRAAVEKAGLSLVVNAEPMEPVFLDRGMWETILLNLLSNAFKFTFEGEIAVSARPSADGRSAIVQVKDTGVGVAAEELPRLFERFHRAEGVHGRSFEGTGIGLALVQELVNLHGGHVGVDSQPGVGTTFTIEIPFGKAHLPADQIRDASTQQATLKSVAFVEEALRWLPTTDEVDAGAAAISGLERVEGASDSLIGAGRQVLLADDNADMRDYVRRLLVAQGYSVQVTADGEAALAAARAEPPDLLLTDVMMPKLDGFGLLRAIRADPALASIPVLMLSARAGEGAKVEGLEGGADDYLVKPFSARELLARVNANIQMAGIRREAALSVLRSEQRFQMTDARLSRALSTGRVAVFEWFIESDRLFIHGSLVESFGVPQPDAIQGRPLQTFLNGVHRDDLERVVAAINASVETGAPYEAEYRVGRDGEQRTVLARGIVDVATEGERRMVGALIDITEEKAAEKALQDLNATLEDRIVAEVRERTKAEDALRQAQKMEAIGQLTGGVAHDFNNLLTLIIGGLDTIRRSRPEDEARMKRATEMALQGAHRAANLTGRLLAFSRRQPLNPKPLETNLLVRDMTELLHRTLGETIELEGVLAPRLWTIEADQNQLESAILNLAVNARDAMPDGGKLTIETGNTLLDENYSATDSEVIPGQYVMIAVSDTGMGMDADTVGRAFEPFFTTKDVGRGTGLGLSMVYGFVKQSGGHVTIYSELGRGTTVKLYFPRHLGGEASVKSEPPMEAPRASRDEVVLVVEDNDEVRQYSVMILTELGYNVLEAGDAEAALAVIKKRGRLDLLFTDVVLPGRTGRVLADEAAKLRPELRVLYTTGYSRNAIVHHGRLDAGVNLITKPFTFDQLAVRVRDVLDMI